jgi:hypothetical protein
MKNMLFYELKVYLSVKDTFIHKGKIKILQCTNLTDSTSLILILYLLDQGSSNMMY